MRDAIYKFIVEFIAKNSYPPTLLEIGVQFGIAKSDVAYHLNNLRAEGKLEWSRGKARTIKIIESAS